MATCKQCEFFDRDKASGKGGRLLPNHPVKCLWKSSEVYPISVYLSSRPMVGYITSHDGAGCKCFQKREE